MAAIESCPPRTVLEQLIVGEIAGSDGERLARHLETCDHCVARVQELPAHSPLVEAARASSTITDGPEAGTVRHLIERLKRLGPPVPEEGPTASGETPPADEPVSLGESVHDFLAPPTRPGELGRLGRFRILRQLGAGGMGIVFQAEDPRLKRTVALKVLRPDAIAKPRARARFLREAQAAAGLEHEHIVAVYEVNDEGGTPYLAMPCLSGMTLEDRLRRSGRLSVPQALRVGRQIARGLAAAHAHALIHRDIKPSNIWLEPQNGGHVKILDFGLARAAEDEEHLTVTGALVGTPAYMAPEQARGDDVDARCDLFSLGVVLYRMCTGQLPFPGRNAMAVLTSLTTHTPRPLREVEPTVPPALEALVLQLLSQDPARRPSCAAEVADRLRAIESSSLLAAQQSATQSSPPLPVTAGPATAPAGPPPRRGRRWPLIAATILLALMPLTILYGTTVVRIATNRGQLVIKVGDPKVQVTVKEHGAIIQDGPGQREIILAAGEHEVEVTITDGNGTTRFFTRKLVLERGGKVIVNAQYELTQVKPRSSDLAVLDADRQAAEWVIAHGGKVSIAPWQWIDDVKALPSGHFRLLQVFLAYSPGVNDAALIQLAQLTDLEYLMLNGTGITDAGLATIRALPKLRVLSLVGTAISDDGLVHLKTMIRLEELALTYTHITEAGLVHVRDLPRLRFLGIGVPLSDRVAADLKAIKNLEMLEVANQPSDDSLTHLESLPQLRVLVLAYSGRITDKGLVHLRALPNLRSIFLPGTLITDVGVARLRMLEVWTKLEALGLSATRITDASLVHLDELPDLQDL